MIGGVDISTLGLHTVRTNMAVITQTPVLFSGCTIRENLDPCKSSQSGFILQSPRYNFYFYILLKDPVASGEEEDERLRNALRAVHMLETIENIPNGLVRLDTSLFFVLV